MGRRNRTGPTDRDRANCPDNALWHTRHVSASSDLAVLSSIVAQVDDLARRVTDLAERYGSSPDSAVAAELFSTERALAAAHRSLDRVSGLLDQLPDEG
jgi:hypothetical protein